MRLFNWLEMRGHPDLWLAQKLGISRAAVHGYRHGKSTPSLENAVKIVQITDGEVQYEDMLSVSINTNNAVNQKENELEDL
jgi:predicted transcriptional regulator